MSSLSSHNSPGKHVDGLRVSYRETEAHRQVAWPQKAMKSTWATEAALGFALSEKVSSFSLSSVFGD